MRKDGMIRPARPTRRRTLRTRKVMRGFKGAEEPLFDFGIIIMG